MTYLGNAAGELSLDQLRYHGLLSVNPTRQEHSLTSSSTFIDAETMRNRIVSAWTPNGRVRRQAYDLRGTPIGDRAEVWKWDRLVYPGRRQQGRRVREYVTVMYCPEGWHSTSGTADEPSEALCSTLMDHQWASAQGGFDRARYDAHHDQHPVSWQVKVKRHTQVRSLRYCDPELPEEYRPQPTVLPLRTSISGTVPGP